MEWRRCRARNGGRRAPTNDGDDKRVTEGEKEREKSSVSFLTTRRNSAKQRNGGEKLGGGSAWGCSGCDLRQGQRELGFGMGCAESGGFYLWSGEACRARLGGELGGGEVRLEEESA